MTTNNYISIEGNLTRDPESQQVPTGSIIVKFDVAVNKKTKKGDNWDEEVSYFTIKKWQGKNENLGTLKKGQKVRIVGELKQERWEKDGKQNSRVVVMANDICLVKKLYETKSESFKDDIPF